MSNKEHHFVVCASFDDDGTAQFYITDSMCDPDKPVWDVDTQTWSRVLDEDQDNDMALFNALAGALNLANRSLLKEKA